jgi:curved DNA-binding protein CbpA
MSRELYDLLGIPRTADSEDIRLAYLLRMRVVHPDRFDRAGQPAEWLQANSMLRELNEAYEILSDPPKRARYDSGIRQAGSQPPQPSHEADASKRADPESSDSAPRENGPGPNDDAVAGFLQLCHRIRLTCWQQIQTGSGDRTARLLVLRAASADYKRRASPWLAIILETTAATRLSLRRHATQPRNA